MKQVLGVIAILLALIAYIPYIRDVLRRKTKPHVYSWFIWGFLSILIALLQFKKRSRSRCLHDSIHGVYQFIDFYLGYAQWQKIYY